MGREGTLSCIKSSSWECGTVQEHVQVIGCSNRRGKGEITLVNAVVPSSRVIKGRE